MIKMSDQSNQDQLGLANQTEQPNDQPAVAGQLDNLPELPTERMAVTGGLEVSNESEAVAGQPEQLGDLFSGPLDPASAGQTGASSVLPEQQPTAKLHSMPPVPPAPAGPPEASSLLPELQPTAKMHSLPVAPPPEASSFVPSVEDAITQPRPSAVVSAPVAQPQPVPMPVPTFPSAPPTVPARPAPPPPRIGTDRRFTGTLVAIALAFLLVGAGILIAGYNAARAELQPAQAAQTFCRDLQSQNYSAAYALLSSSYRAQVTMTEFARSSQLQDQVDGKIRACPTATGPSIDLSFATPGDHQSFLITIVRNKPLRGHIALFREQGSWKVEGLEQALAGTNLGPLLVADTFCQALIAGNYAAAYSTLSSRQQSLATEQAFALQFSSALGGPVKLNSCTMEYSTYTIRAGAAAIATTFNLTISTATGGTLSTDLKTVLSFIQENGVWKVDDFSLQPSVS